jgi:hypothetical protein
MEKQTALIKADIFWCSNYVKNKQGKYYTVDLCNLSENAVRALQDLGIEVKHDPVKKPEQGYYVTAKSMNYVIHTFDKDGKELGKWKKTDDGKGTEVIRDEQGNPQYTRISNKSKALATVSPYRVMYNGKPLIQTQINKLVVTELIEYIPENAVNLADLEEQAL